MKKIVVLGAGLVGGVMAQDLAKDHQVTTIDISQDNLDKLDSNISKICADISDTSILHKYIK
ncbi:MAG: saccharopine dehydrogenase, partial [Flavobacteriales bacterium]|nr:saccharopine dehydrogenase [Flavobacteriales bacterium]